MEKTYHGPYYADVLDERVREVLKEYHRKKTELERNLKPGQWICNHLNPHVCGPYEGEEEKFINWLSDYGWFGNAGYCAVYYPKWLEQAYKDQNKA